ncbi:hypothetical protein BJ165DRAFT_376657 [Panaeolus papilionaceus]|nr:hypothetical protein BJ165DRAFT_376657 [Panaeolus papilionaceus]
MLSKVKEVGEFFNNEKKYGKAEADLDAQVKILETLKQQADREAAALQSALDAVEKIKNDLPSLVEKMNAFATVWTKLSEDANKLNEYLNTGTPDIEQMFSVDAVLAQKDVYVALLKALDTYCLKVA